MQSLVWTNVIRLSHWLIAAGVILDWLNETGYWHRVIGYGCLLMVVLRVIYGVMSKIPSARFYLPGFTQMKTHLQDVALGKAHVGTGHNPLGQWAVYAMWLLIGLLAFTGWISRTELYWGEDAPVDLHRLLSTLLMYMVILHVFSVVLMSYLTRQNLIKQMLTGKQSSLSENDHE
ncbi:MAG: cytochrome B [Methylophilaceae bacterium]|nr:cytochrome B [Methylophilaceae bacterium]